MGILRQEGLPQALFFVILAGERRLRGQYRWPAAATCERVGNEP